MRKIMQFLKRRSRQFLLTTALLAGLLAVTTSTINALPEYWCPPCSSDACQAGGAAFVVIVGGQCYCCFPIS